jgi:bacterioferritin-associated ferredoxin
LSRKEVNEMPSDKKRINLTIPDEIYERLQAYKNETGIVNDATACLQLIVQQLNAHANNKAVLHFLQNSTLEQLQQAANEGAAQFQELREKGIT